MKSFTKKPLTAALVASMGLLGSVSVYALQEIKDSELSKVSGGELLQVTTINPGELGNPNGNVGFFRMMLDAKLEVNSNINKIRLGCDNPSGDGPCDISIDKLGLSGLVPKTGGTTQTYDPNAPLGKKASEAGTRVNYVASIQSAFQNPKDAGAGTDFVMDKPFLELAIKNPDSLTDREIVGYRFGAYENWGMMSTGEAPPLNADGTTNVPIYGPVSYGSTQLKNYGAGQDALDALWNVMKDGTDNKSPERKARYPEFLDYVNASIERGHTGVNYITGRLPVRINKLNVNARVYEASTGLSDFLNAGQTITVAAQTAIVSGKLSRSDDSDFGRWRNAPSPGVGQPDPDGDGKFVKGYWRNVYAGDSDTVYDPAIYGNYIANTALVGRANEFKRGQRALLDDMIVHVHSIKPDLGLVQFLSNLGVSQTQIDGILAAETGDRLNSQDIGTKTFHLLQYGEDLNGNGKYDPGEGSKHQAFSYQTLDGLQWITTDKRISSSYDNNGNPTGTPLGPNGGYDWLSTRAGWWLESPLATVSGYVPPGQTTTYGVPELDSKIVLKSLDLGTRPIDNCYGNLTFC